MTKYTRCDERDIPAAVRFDVPGRNQGQMIEVAYGGLDRGEHDYGDPFKRIKDENGRVTYYRAEGIRVPSRTITINGTIVALPPDAVAYKYADPIEDARWIYDEDEAADLAKIDPRLIVRPVSL